MTALGQCSRVSCVQTRGPSAVQVHRTWKVGSSPTPQSPDVEISGFPEGRLAAASLLPALPSQSIHSPSGSAQTQPIPGSPWLQTGWQCGSGFYQLPGKGGACRATGSLGTEAGEGGACLTGRPAQGCHSFPDCAHRFTLAHWTAGDIKDGVLLRSQTGLTVQDPGGRLVPCRPQFPCP